MDIEDAEARCSFEWQFCGGKSPESVAHVQRLKQQRDELIAVGG
jgi:hypothetical protein